MKTYADIGHSFFSAPKPQPVPKRKAWKNNAPAAPNRFKIALDYALKLLNDDPEMPIRFAAVWAGRQAKVDSFALEKALSGKIPESLRRECYRMELQARQNLELEYT